MGKLQMWGQGPRLHFKKVKFLVPSKTLKLGVLVLCDTGKQMSVLSCLLFRLRNTPI